MHETNASFITHFLIIITVIVIVIIYYYTTTTLFLPLFKRLIVWRGAVQ